MFVKASLKKNIFLPDMVVRHNNEPDYENDCAGKKCPPSFSKYVNLISKVISFQVGPVPMPRTKRGRRVASEDGESMWSHGGNSRIPSDKRKPLIWSGREEDFNLTELINSVEKDIWLLEQMEAGLPMISKLNRLHMIILT